MSIETEVAQTLGEVNEILKEIAKEKIDPSVYTKILQECANSLKIELEGVADTALRKMGIKRCIELVDLHLYRSHAYRVVYKRMDNGNILRYGGLYMRGCSLSNVSAGCNRGTSAFWSRVALPREIEFENFWGGHNGFFAQPKKGQTLGEESLDNSLWVWGVNTDGCLGVGNTSNVDIPKRVDLPTRALKICVGHSENTGYQTSLLLGEDGFVYGCGRNGYGELGIGNTINPNAWTKSPTLLNMKDIALASNGSVGYSMGINRSGELYVWGWGGGYALGNGSTSNVLTPTKIVTSGRVVGIFPSIWRESSSYYQTSFILLEDKSLWGAGYNGQKNISQNHTNNVTSFSKISLEDNTPLANIIKVGASSVYGTSFALDEEGNLYAWGYGAYGFGDSGSLSYNQRARVRLENVQDFWAVCDKQYTRCLAKLKNGSFKAFGLNSDRGCGIGASNDWYGWGEVIIPDGELEGIKWQCFNAEGGLTCIVDNEFYACGTSLDYSINFTCGTLQRQL